MATIRTTTPPPHLAAEDRPTVLRGGPGPRPQPRGPGSAAMLELLACPPGATDHLGPVPDDDPVVGEDSALCLYLHYELHYQGIAGVDDRWEWHPGLLERRAVLEERFVARLRELVGEVPDVADVTAFLQSQFAGHGESRSVARWCDEHGHLVHLREQAVLRSPYQLKEADPHTWAIPRLHGVPKAALVEIQADEYGEGVAKDMHAELFALTMERLGLDPTYGAHVDLVGATTLSGVSMVSMFGLHRRWRGAAIGHLALFEMASPPVMATLSSALRRLGFDEWTRLFYDTHVVADAHHQTVAAEQLAGGLVAQDPRLARDVAFGALALEALEALATDETLDAWEAGRSALRRPLSPIAQAPGQVAHHLPADDPRDRG